MPKNPRPILVQSPTVRVPRVKAPWELDGLGDIGALLDVLGTTTLVGFYDVRTGVGQSGGFVDTWDDVRGATAGGPQLVGTTTTRPAISAAGITFDGVDDFLRNATAGRLAEVTGDCGIVLVTAGIAGNVAQKNYATLSTSANARALEVYNDSVTVGIKVLAVAAAATTYTYDGTTIHVIHGRRQGTGTMTVGAAIGTAAETTGTGATTPSAVGLLTVGASGAASPATFGPLTTLRAILLYNADYAGKQTTVTAWAQANHGAVAV